MEKNLLKKFYYLYHFRVAGFIPTAQTFLYEELIPKHLKESQAAQRRERKDGIQQALTNIVF